MPYEIRKVKNEYCVYKKTGGESLGCHPTREEAQKQIAATHANEAKSYVIKSDGDGLRLMVIRSSNAYLDREKEIVRQKALQGYVETCWKDNVFVGDNPLLLWHAGDPIGDIIYAEMIGPFLLEVARERPDAVVNLAEDGAPRIETTVRTVWDALENEPNMGASIQFFYVTSDREDGIYDMIYKIETSVLPRWAAANYITDSEIVRRSE
jgi:hypothetical protein